MTGPFDIPTATWTLIHRERARMPNSMLNDVLSSDVSHESYANHESRTIGPDSSTQATLGVTGALTQDKFAFPQLTKRELFAAMAMHGLLSDFKTIGIFFDNAEEGEDGPGNITKTAVTYANQLIRALAKNT